MTREERFKMDMIDEFKLMCKIVGENGRIIANKHRMLKALEQEPRKGHWIAVENDEMEIVQYYCSECDLPMETKERTDYCPNCGAKMAESEVKE